MSFQSIMEMKELKLEPEESISQSDEDCDICDFEEIKKLFEECNLISEEHVALNNKYILQIGATQETNPNVAASLSDYTCEVYNLSNNQFAKLTTLSEHTDVISEVKFSNENSNLLYTGSNDGTIKLWDLRTPKESIVFKDTTVENRSKTKSITSFDISSNNILLAAGTNLFAGDAFILYWDLRKNSFLGGYWESHTDDITQVKFHPTDPNKLMSGSVDGLINLYDLSKKSEDDALIDSLNTESSVDKIKWLTDKNRYIIGCITNTVDVQFWRVEDAQPYLHLRRPDIAKGINRKYGDYIYVVDLHEDLNSIFVLAGSSYRDGECLRGLSVVKNSIYPLMRFNQNKQTVRASWLNYHTNLLLTGGEKGILCAWSFRK